MKNGSELSLNIDVVQRLDAKVLITVIQDFRTLKTIQFFSEVCSLQQLERKNALITFSQQKQADLEQKKLSQNSQDTLLLMRAFQQNMQESRCLKTLHLIGMRFSKEAYGILGEGIATAKTLKRLIINQTNIGSYGLAKLAAGFS